MTLLMKSFIDSLRNHVVEVNPIMHEVKYHKGLPIMIKEMYILKTDRCEYLVTQYGGNGICRLGFSCRYESNQPFDEHLAEGVISFETLDIMRMRFMQNEQRQRVDLTV